MNKKISTGVAFLVIAILAVFLVGIVWYLSKGINVENKTVIDMPNKKNESKNKIPKKGNVMCTQEIKNCPDGSYVARTGPNCEFAPCPNENDTHQIANPASTYCQENGGALEIRTGADGGQVGFCKFPDGSECEEWAFMRGECKAGNDQNANIDTSDWQNYLNKKYGFEFKYPKEWKVPSIRENPDGDDLSTWKHYAYIKLGCPDVKMGGAGACPLDMIIYPVSKPESFLSEDYVPAKDQDSSKRSEILYSQINSINTATFTDFEGYYGDSKKVVFFGDKYYLIFSDYLFNYQENGIFDKIISTFKFIN